jgi:hypothetical protein
MNATKDNGSSMRDFSCVTYMSSKLVYRLNESRDSLMELLTKILERNREEYKLHWRSLDNDD